MIKILCIFHLYNSKYQKCFHKGVRNGTEDMFSIYKLKKRQKQTQIGQPIAVLYQVEYVESDGLVGFLSRLVGSESYKFMSTSNDNYIEIFDK